MISLRPVLAALLALWLSSCASVSVTQHRLAIQGLKLRQMTVAVGPVMVRGEAADVAPAHRQEMQRDMAARLQAGRVIPGPEFQALVGAVPWALPIGAPQRALTAAQTTKAAAAGIDAVLIVDICRNDIDHGVRRHCRMGSYTDGSGESISYSEVVNRATTLRCLQATYSLLDTRTRQTLWQADVELGFGSYNDGENQGGTPQTPAPPEALSPADVLRKMTKATLKLLR